MRTISKKTQNERKILNKIQNVRKIPKNSKIVQKFPLSTKHFIGLNSSYTLKPSWEPLGHLFLLIIVFLFKVVAVVTGANIVKAIKDFTPFRQILCFAHTLNLAVTDAHKDSSNFSNVSNFSKNVEKLWHI